MGVRQSKLWKQESTNTGGKAQMRYKILLSASLHIWHLTLRMVSFQTGKMVLPSHLRNYLGKSGAAITNKKRGLRFNLSHKWDQATHRRAVTWPLTGRHQLPAEVWWYHTQHQKLLLHVRKLQNIKQKTTTTSTTKYKAVLEPRVSPAFAITYFCNHCNI